MSPVLVDAEDPRASKRKLVVYGSKSGMYFILDRRDGSAPLGIDEVPVPQDPRQTTRRRSRSRARALDRELRRRSAARHCAFPDNPDRAVPNYCAAACTRRTGTSPILSMPGHGGGADWNHQSFSQSTGLVYTGFGYVAAAHSLTESSNGLRPPGEYQTGGSSPSIRARIACAGRSECPTRWRMATES